MCVRILLLLAVLLAGSEAYAGLLGKTIDFQRLGPDIVTPQGDTANGSYVVGADVEVVDTANSLPFAASRLSFDADHLWINLAGMSFQPGDRLVLNIGMDTNGSQVPEPATLSLMLCGMGVMAVRRKCIRSFGTGSRRTSSRAEHGLRAVAWHALAHRRCGHDEPRCLTEPHRAAGTRLQLSRGSIHGH